MVQVKRTSSNLKGKKNEGMGQIKPYVAFEVKISSYLEGILIFSYSKCKET